MNSYRARLQVQGLLKIPIVSDTLWGHVAWGIALEQGDDALKAFLEAYSSAPPLILSNAFPAGFLPRPLFQSPPPESDHIKGLTNILYVPKELFSTPLTWSVLNTMLGKESIFYVGLSPTTRIRNAINRFSATVEEGKLWSEAGFYWYTKATKSSKVQPVTTFDVYCLTTFDQKTLEQCIDQGLYWGYGGKSSTGYGNVRLLEVVTESLPQTGNRSMALGTFVPSEAEKLDNLLTKVTVRSGKLGPVFAETMNPFKKPIAFYDEGSTFDSASIDSRNYVGMLLKDVHPDPRICSCGFTVCCRFQEGENKNDGL